MKITITIKNDVTGKEYDLSLDNKQRLETTLGVLKDNLPGALDGIEVPSIQSERSRRHLSLNQTYEEIPIFSGDRLIVSPN